MNRENYNELIEMIDSVGPDDIAHFASYGGYNKDSLQHTREISELISAFGSSYSKEKSNFLHNVSKCYQCHSDDMEFVLMCCQCGSTTEVKSNAC